MHDSGAIQKSLIFAMFREFRLYFRIRADVSPAARFITLTGSSWLQKPEHSVRAFLEEAFQIPSSPSDPVLSAKRGIFSPALRPRVSQRSASGRFPS